MSACLLDLFFSPPWGCSVSPENSPWMMPPEGDILGPCSQGVGQWGGLGIQAFLMQLSVNSLSPLWPAPWNLTPSCKFSNDYFLVFCQRVGEVGLTTLGTAFQSVSCAKKPVPSLPVLSWLLQAQAPQGFSQPWLLTFYSKTSEGALRLWFHLLPLPVEFLLALVSL